MKLSYNELLLKSKKVKVSEQDGAFFKELEVSVLPQVSYFGARIPSFYLESEDGASVRFYHYVLGRADTVVVNRDEKVFELINES